MSLPETDLLVGRVCIEVFGRPTTQGSKKAFVHAKTGKAILTEQMGAQLHTWREDVRQAAKPWQGAFGPKEPLELAVHFTLAKPTSAPKRRRSWPVSRRNDLDKLLRSTLDALTSSGVYDDDSQIISVQATKSYPGEGLGPTIPGAWIEIRAVTI